MPSCVRLMWAVSGQGRALQAILAAIDSGLLPVQIAAIVTDRQSPIEAVAQIRGLPCHRIEPANQDELSELLTLYRSDWLGLTYNRLLPERVIAQLRGRVFNLHMSLLPMFPGFGALQRTLDSGMRLTGATVHLVDARMDMGSILAQVACAVTATDTRETLGRRLFEMALPLLLQVVRSIANRDLVYDPERGLDWARASIVPDGAMHAFPAFDPDLAAFATAFCAELPMPKPKAFSSDTVVP